MNTFIHLRCRHFSRRQAAASFGAGACCRSHQSVCPISLRKRPKKSGESGKSWQRSVFACFSRSPLVYGKGRESPRPERRNALLEKI